MKKLICKLHDWLWRVDHHCHPGDAHVTYRIRDDSDVLLGRAHTLLECARTHLEAAKPKKEESDDR